MPKKKRALEHSRYPGEDDVRLMDIERQLFSAFKPEDILEEIWLSEIASLTSSIEYYRELEIFKNQAIVEKFEPIDTSDGLAAGFLLAKNPFHIKRILGFFDQDDIKHLASIIDITAKLRRERERIYLQFERKRRALVINVVNEVELKQERTIAIEALSD
jgi:hypothetical protein